MNFCDQLNKYIEQIDCSSQELVVASGICQSRQFCLILFSCLKLKNKSTCLS